MVDRLISWTLWACLAGMLLAEVSLAVNTLGACR